MRILPAFAAALLAACGEKTPPAPAPADAIAPAPAPADVTAPAPDKAVGECEIILERSWAAVSPVIERLGVPADKATEAQFMGDRAWLAACVTLPAAQRDCLTDSENPVAGVFTCGVNAAAQTLASFDFAPLVKLWPSKPLTADEIAARYAWIEGTWTVEWARQKAKRRWVIGKEGGIAKVESVDGNPLPPPVPDKIDFVTSRALTMHFKQNAGTWTYTFFKDGDDVFYASTNRQLEAFPIPDEKHFVVRSGRDFIAYDDGRCELILGVGMAMPATCEFSESDGLRRFRATYQRPDWRQPSVAAFVVAGQHLVVQGLYDSGRFVREKAKAP